MFYDKQYIGWRVLPKTSNEDCFLVKPGNHLQGGNEKLQIGKITWPWMGVQKNVNKNRLIEFEMKTQMTKYVHSPLKIK